jgi:hypothetical protein
MNFTAVWLWERLNALGPLAWELVDLELTPSEAALLLEQLYELVTYSRYLEGLTQGKGDG